MQKHFCGAFWGVQRAGDENEMEIVLLTEFSQIMVVEDVRL